MQGHRPEAIARHTVQQNGGEYVTDVPDLLALFGRQQLTNAARRDVRAALQDVGVGTDPDLLVAKRSDAVRLFLLQRESVGGTVGWSSRPGWLTRFRPHSWKGWLVYGFVALLLLGAMTGDSENATDPGPGQTVGSETPAAASGEAEEGEAREAARRAREAVRKERARTRRLRARARRDRARARRVAAAAREERERQAELEAEAVAAAEAEEAAAAEAAAAEAAAGCHPSYEPCLEPTASDYDCEGGSGDGPMYTGVVAVKGPDDYDLDSDDDGTGCDP